EFETKFFNPPVDGTNISAVTFRDRLVIPSLAPDKSELSSAGSLGIIKKVLADVPIYSLAEQYRLKKIFEKENLDILHVPHWNTPVFYKGKMVVTIHDLVPLDFVSTKRAKLSQWLRRKYFYLILKILGQKAQKIIAVSNLTRDDLINRIKINPEKIETIYSGIVSPKAYEEAAKIPKEEARQMIKNEFKINGPYFFAGGIWRTHKNLDGLISAFKKTLEMMPSSGAKLLIGGVADKSFPDVLNLFQKYQNDPAIIFLGMLDVEKQALLMRGAVADILSSFLEGFGFFYLEALSAGGDLVSSKNVGAKEVAGGSVEFFDPKNIDELAQKMIEKIKNPEACHRQFVLKSGTSWQNTAEKVYKIYTAH
ncbi:MAG: glycosyltransferase family 1 protein, partial [Patescibacteria group bacterium]